MFRFFLITFLSILAIIGAVTPVAVFAQRPVPPGELDYDKAYVPCGTVDVKGAEKEIIENGVKKTIVTGDGKVDNPCQFTDVIVLAKRIIMGWIIFGVTAATMGFSYAGLLYITAMGSQEKISQAHSIFVKTFWGFFFMLSAWLIAYTMEGIFLKEDMLKNSFLHRTD